MGFFSISLRRYLCLWTGWGKAVPIQCEYVSIALVPLGSSKRLYFAAKLLHSFSMSRANGMEGWDIPAPTRKKNGDLLERPLSSQACLMWLAAELRSRVFIGTVGRILLQ